MWICNLKRLLKRGKSRILEILILDMDESGNFGYDQLFVEIVSQIGSGVADWSWRLDLRCCVTVEKDTSWNIIYIFLYASYMHHRVSLYAPPCRTRCCSSSWRGECEYGTIRVRVRTTDIERDRRGTRQAVAGYAVFQPYQPYPCPNPVCQTFKVRLASNWAQNSG